MKKQNKYSIFATSRQDATGNDSVTCWHININRHMTQKEEQQKKDELYMRKALAEAEMAYGKGEIPIGAVVVCGW